MRVISINVQSNMALQAIHDYYATTLQAEMQAGKYSKLRWFRFEGMSSDKGDGPDGKSDSTYPLWVRHMGEAAFASACGDTYCDGTDRHTWFNASFGASYAAPAPFENGSVFVNIAQHSAHSLI